MVNTENDNNNYEKDLKSTKFKGKMQSTFMLTTQRNSIVGMSFYGF